MPRVTDIDEAKRSPELAVLSVQAHGADEPHSLAVAVAALAAARDLDDERAMLYCDLVYLAVGEATRQQLEELMQSGTYEYQSEFAKKYLAEGKIEGKIEALLQIIAVRDLAMSPDQEARIRGCDDATVLDKWIQQALVGDSLQLSTES